MTWSVLAGQVAALPKPSEFELSHLYTKSLLRGTGERVAAQQRRVKVASAGLIAGAALGGGLMWLRRQRR
jgi:hypothetical protein